MGLIFPLYCKIFFLIANSSLFTIIYISILALIKENMSQKSNSFASIFLQYLQSVFLDIRKVYQHFFHWNFSKIMISLVSFLIGILVSLPLFLIVVILMSLDSIDWISLIGGILAAKPLGFEIISQFLSAPFFVIIEALLLFCASLLFIAGYNYTGFLSARLYLTYKEGKELPVLRKDYFQKEYVLKFLQIFLWQVLYLAIALLFLLVIGLILLMIFRAGFLSFDMFSLLLLGVFLISLVGAFYIGYRVYFAIFLFADRRDTDQSARSYIKESLTITRGKSLFLFLALFCIVNLVFSPLYFIGDSLDREESEAKDYLSYRTTVQELEQDEQIYYEYLQEKFQGKSDDQVVKSILVGNFIGFCFAILLFLFIEGLMFVVSVWFYKEILLQGKKQHKTNIFSKWWKKGEL